MTSGPGSQSTVPYPAPSSAVTSSSGGIGPSIGGQPGSRNVPARSGPGDLSHWSIPLSYPTGLSHWRASQEGQHAEPGRPDDAGDHAAAQPDQPQRGQGQQAGLPQMAEGQAERDGRAGDGADG